MKQPYEIHSDFFKKMIALGWYENREIILDSLPHHLEELPDNVKKFLREIWYLTISYDLSLSQTSERSKGMVDISDPRGYFFSKTKKQLFAMKIVVIRKN